MGSSFSVFTALGLRVSPREDSLSIANVSGSGGWGGGGGAGQGFPTSPMRVRQEDFEVVWRLGRGRFGSVFLVNMKDTTHQFAMKVVSKASTVDSDGACLRDLCRRTKIRGQRITL